MKSKTALESGSRLAGVLPGNQFREYHHGIVNAPVDRVWDELQRLSLDDLSVTRPLFLVRGGGQAPLGSMIELFVQRAGAVPVLDPPGSLLAVMVGKPWSMRPQRVVLSSVEEVAAFAEPGWLKYGMEWALHPLPGDRTLVETWTLCEATDRTAHRAFSAYWALIRGGSGLIRRDLIVALGRRAKLAAVA